MHTYDVGKLKYKPIRSEGSCKLRHSSYRISAALRKMRTRRNSVSNEAAPSALYIIQ